MCIGACVRPRVIHILKALTQALYFYLKGNYNSKLVQIYLITHTHTHTYIYIYNSEEDNININSSLLLIQNKTLCGILQPRINQSQGLIIIKPPPPKKVNIINTQYKLII